MSITLDPDQDWHSIGPDLDLNCLQRLSADNKVATRLSMERVNVYSKHVPYCTQ